MEHKDIKSKKYTGVYYRLRENGEKTFYILYKHPTTGKKERMKVGKSEEGCNERFANNLRIEVIGRLRIGDENHIPILAKKRQQTTLNDLAERYFAAKRAEKPGRSTEGRASKYAKHFADGIGARPLSSVTRRDVERLKRELIAAGYAGQTVNSTLEMASTIVNHAARKHDYKGGNPFSGIDKMPVNNQRKRYLSPDEIKALLDEVAHNPTLHLFTLLALRTGARLTAILRIQVKDVNFNGGTIDLHDIKSGGTYKGFIIEDVKELLTAHVNGRSRNDYVVSPTGAPIRDVKRIQRPLKAILDRLFNVGLDESDRVNRVVIHTLRHTFGSLLAINGTPIYTIQNLMHHKDIKETTRYAKLSPDTGREEVARIF